MTRGPTDGVVSLYDAAGKPTPKARLMTRRLAAADPRLEALIAAAGPFNQTRRPAKTSFESLARSVVYQQLSGKAAAAIVKNLMSKFPHGGFPTPQEVVDAPEGTLRAAGLSNAKARSVRDIAEKALDGTLPSLKEMAKLSDEALVERLVVLRGVGEWTVHMLMMFQLGRPDVLPVGDYGVRKGFQRTYRTRSLPTAAQLERRAEKWRPYRSVASWYMWRALELP